MENGTDEQDATGAEDSQGSFDDEHSSDAGADGGALEEGQAGSEAGQFDANSPEARHFQSLLDKKTAAFERELSRLKTQVSGQAQTQPEPTIDDIVDYSSFQMPHEPAGELADFGLDDRVLALLEKRFDARAQALAKHTLGGVDSYNRRQFAQQQQQSAVQKIGAFVETHIEQRDAILRIYDEMPEVAARNPDRFLKMVEADLGLRTPGKEPPKRGLASTVQSASTRPTRNGNAPARKPAPQSLREIITGVANAKGW